MSTSWSGNDRSRRKLLILFDGDFVGGAEVNFRFIIPELNRRGIDSVIAAPGASELGAYFHRFDVPVEILPVLRPYRSFREGGRLSPLNIAASYRSLRVNSRRLRSILEDRKPRWCVSNSMVSHWLLARVAPEARKQGSGTVMFLQDIVDRAKAMGGYGRGLDWIASRVDHVITISDAVGATLRDFPAAKVTRLYNPVPSARPSRRRSGGPLRAGLFARYTAWKGHADFLKIAAACADEPVEFVSYGNVSHDDRRYFDSIRSEASRLPNAQTVKVSEFTPDVLQAMADCDVILHLSRLPEPFGRVLIEANWLGVPVLAYRGGGVDELFATLALGGETFENGDWVGIVDRLKKFRRATYSMPELSELEPAKYADRLMAVLERVPNQ
jgi:glycosyltransferase involved in cell wall biosynthesis